MSTVLVTTNEPKKIKELFSDSIEVPMNFDFKIYTEKGTVGIERKAVPSDLLASIEDGRLQREITAMRDECDHQVILLHGTIKYNREGRVMFGKRTSRWTKIGVDNVLRTLAWVEECFIERASTDTDLVRVIDELQGYLDKGRHMSIKGRPGIQKEWIVKSKIEEMIHFYDGLPGVAPVRAKLLVAAFPKPLDIFKANINDIAAVAGFGKTGAENIYNFLRGEL